MRTDFVLLLYSSTQDRCYSISRPNTTIKPCAGQHLISASQAVHSKLLSGSWDQQDRAMSDGWHSSTSGGSRPGFDSYVKSPEEHDRDQFLAAPPMDRNKLSGSSTDSRRSTGSYQDQSYAESPLTSCGSPQSEGDLTPQYDYLSPDTAAPSREPSERVFLFDIERYGDPRIEWIMYYDFIVTKSEAYYQLQPGYLPTKKYPSRVSVK